MERAAGFGANNLTARQPDSRANQGTTAVLQCCERQDRTRTGRLAKAEIDPTCRLSDTNPSRPLSSTVYLDLESAAELDGVPYGQVLTQIMEGRLEGVEFRIYPLRIAGDRDCTGGPR